MKKAFMAVYSSIEFYPPSLNALTNIVTYFSKISILSRNVKSLQWDYTANVENIQSGNFTDIRNAEKKSMYWKIHSFILFTWNMLRNLQKEKPDLVILYDAIPTLSYYLIHNFISHKPLLWYHNHDVLELSKTKKYTIAWAAALAEKRIFKEIDFFSLPAQDRKPYFPLETLKGQYFFIPNVPAKSFYGSYYNPKKPQADTIKLVYQGSLAKGQGFEQLISLIELGSCSKKIIFDIKTFHSYSEYNETLKKQITEKGLENYIKLLDTSPYSVMPNFTKQYDIGLAIFSENSVLRSTAGTASNKIYEYISVGLPVILYDNKHFREQLGKYEWAFFTDLSEESLLDCIEKIIANYEYLSQKAHEDFESHLNFETYFTPVIEQVMEKIKS